MAAVENDVVQAAWPEVTVTAEQPLIVVLFAVNATVPAGDTPPLTVAVNVTDCPTVEGFTLEATAVVVFALVTVWDRLPLLPELLLSPE